MSDDRRKLASIALVLCVALPASACGSDGDTSASGGHDHENAGGHEHDAGSTTGFGEPGDPSEATRTIEVEATDKLRFEPAPA